jgi:site-specific recombinase XerD
VDRKRERVCFRGPKEKDDKYVDLSPELLEYINMAERTRLGPYVFMHPEGRPLTPHNVYTIVQRMARLAGVKINPHLLRRSRITHALEDGTPSTVVRDMAGHKNLSTTEKYYESNINQQRAHRDKLSLRRALKKPTEPQAEGQ